MCRFGLDSEDRLHLDVLGGSWNSLLGRTSLFAFCGPNISSEFQMLQSLKDFNPTEIPLLPTILSGAHRTKSEFREKLCTKRQSIIVSIEEHMLREEGDRVIQEFELNEEQGSVIEVL